MNRLHRLWPLLAILLLLLSACGGAAPDAAPGGEDAGAGEEEAQDQVIVTMENTKETLNLKIGQSALMKLDPAYDWTFVVTPALVASQVKDAVLPEDAQAEITAKLAGAAVIQATGTPKCKADNPPCDTARSQLNIKIKVTPQ